MWLTGKGNRSWLLDQSVGVEGKESKEIDGVSV